MSTLPTATDQYCEEPITFGLRRVKQPFPSSKPSWGTWSSYRTGHILTLFQVQNSSLRGSLVTKAC